ncbi:integrin alpha-8-like isoform X1 [Asterias amurensis]|uniref:integrin alpha-8-like isoform X1 n=1 Tax=Asterias amurensis TaxID=7602 RepID=UPI003AB83219
MLMRTLLIVSGILLWENGSYAFNMDTDKAIVHGGTNGSLFGYTVAFHREGNINMLLVGAPRAQTSQPDVDKGGAVYRCPVWAGDCRQIDFDTTGHPMNEAGQQDGSKSHQFFGATLQSSGPDGVVVACAPRRVWSLTDFESQDSRRYPAGACFTATNNFGDIEEFTPCIDPRQPGVHKTSACEAGFSAAFTEDLQLILGGPGSFYFQGQVISVALNSSDVQFTPERDIIFDNFYRGYSVVTGRFGPTGVYAASAPRGEGLLGVVSVWNEDLTATDIEIVGSQVAAYFGHALVATDVNNDGLDDLIIGAPMYVDPDSLIERWEVGQVHVYLQNALGEFTETDTLTGTHPGGQFGFSIASLGDINYDDFNDIAVGAPYADDGIVYIYQGRRKGIKQTVSQILRPSDFGLNIKSFGTSLTGGMDMDGNEYKDMMVGASVSSTAVLVRARPIVKVQKTLSFEPEQINLDVKDYRLPTGRIATSFNVTACFSTRGIGIPDNIDVQYSLELDVSLTTTDRAAFVQENNLESSKLTRTIQLIKDDSFKCQKHLAYVKIVIQEKNFPISVRLTYELASSMTNPMDPVNSEVQPILNELPVPVLVEPLLIQNTCKNYLCVPDLLLTAKTTTDLVALGDDWELSIDVDVTNYGEDAYESSFTAVLPDGAAFARLQRISKDLSVECLADENTGEVECDIGNPLPEEHTVSFRLIIRNDGLSGAASMFTIEMSVDSYNYEPRNISGDNYANVTVGVYAAAELSLFGISAPQQVLFFFPNESQIESLQEPETEQEVGPEVQHLYMLRNLGPSEIGETEVKIFWPLVDADGDYLLYLVSANLGTGEACTVEGGVNPDGLELEPVNINGTSSRKRRQAADNGTSEAIPQSQTAKTIECNTKSSFCVAITCTVAAPSGAGADKDSAFVRIKSRMYEKTFFEKTYSKVLITSMATATVLEMPYIQSLLPDVFPVAYSEVSTQVIGQSKSGIPGPTVTNIPLWAYIVAVIGGGLLLAIIFFIMWKVGFFKRKKIVPGDPQAAAQENWQNDVLVPEKK